jgi:hypothetical protein
MPVWRLQTAWQLDSAFPRDKVIITPHFNDTGVGTDPQELTQDLAAALDGWFATTCELKVTAYDAQGTPPVYPQGETILRPTATQPSGQPRELACCLSFYSERNIPRQRGRLYVPAHFLTSGAPGVRPNTTVTAKVAALAPIFEALGGADVDWCVYSRLDDTPRSVTNWWVDNEWDVMRSRGLRGEIRVTGTTSEG